MSPKSTFHVSLTAKIREPFPQLPFLKLITHFILKLLRKIEFYR